MLFYLLALNETMTMWFLSCSPGISKQVKDSYLCSLLTWFMISVECHLVQWAFSSITGTKVYMLRTLSCFWDPYNYFPFLGSEEKRRSMCSLGFHQFFSFITVLKYSSISNRIKIIFTVNHYLCCFIPFFLTSFVFFTK